MKTLVAYFSHKGENYISGEIKILTKGNAECLAEFAAKALNADLFEIEREQPYDIHYGKCCDEAKLEQQQKALPKLKKELSSIEEYNKIVLVYPCWWGTMPQPVFTFLSQHNFSGKTIYPICTHEGSGMGKSEQDLKVNTQAEIKTGLAIKGSRAQYSKQEVENYLLQN